MTKQFWIVLVIIVAVVFGAFFINNNRTNSKDNGSSSGKVTSHVEGSASKGVLLVEYGDYQCPACGSFFPSVKQTVAKYSDQIQFQFVNFPLVSLHPNAFAAARAAEAAGLQNKYWQMHDLLYEQNDAYYASNESTATWINSSNPMSYFTQYAQQLGLNVNQFNQDYASSKVNDAINADMAAGNKLNVDSTPTFILDGKMLDSSKLIDSKNQPSVDKFSALIDAAIAEKAKQPATSN